MEKDCLLRLLVGYRQIKRKKQYLAGRLPYPPEIIGHAVWLYFRFSLELSRIVEELLAQRGIVVTCETVRQWCLKFGQTYANELRRRRPRCGDTWHMDEVVLTLCGKKTLPLASGRSGW